MLRVGQHGQHAMQLLDSWLVQSSQALPLLQLHWPVTWRRGPVCLRALGQLRRVWAWLQSEWQLRGSMGPAGVSRRGKPPLALPAWMAGGAAYAWSERFRRRPDQLTAPNTAAPDTLAPDTQELSDMHED
eukprot:jgi/Ulvmu1/7931/UM004_0163.1